MKNKVFILDLDGTLLPSNKRIPLFTKLYLRNLSKKGYSILLASGRPARSMLVFHKQLNLNTPLISLNGHHIKNLNNDKKDIRIYFDKNMIRDISNVFYKKYDVKNIICETDTDIYITNKEAYVNPKFWLLDMKVHYMKLDDILKNNVMTFIIEIDKDQVDQIKIDELFKEFPNYCARLWKGEYKGYIEVYDINQNKYLGFQKILKEYPEYTNKNYFYFGDDLNDIEMFINIKNSYCMKNGLESNKKYAKNITSFDNEHEGVKKEIKKILKKSI